MARERSELNVDDVIDRLLSVGRPGTVLTALVSENEVELLCLEAKKQFLAQPSLLEIDPPVNICGDIHGQYGDLMRLFARAGFPPGQNFLFLGDYIDRGKRNLETIALLLAFKIKWPDNFLLLRGNHETPTVNRLYGFYDECQRRYRSVRLWQTFQGLFSVMPLAALVGGRILCMHGGLSPSLQSLDQLRAIKRPLTEPACPSLQLDLMWADPDPSVQGFRANLRGVSCVFGADVVATACQQLNIDLICRAHQVVQDGYEFFAGRRLVTVFSAPHYCGEFDNAAAYLSVSEKLECSFTVLRPSFASTKIQPAKKASSPVQNTCYVKI